MTVFPLVTFFEFVLFTFYSLDLEKMEHSPSTYVGKDARLFLDYREKREVFQLLQVQRR